MPQAIAITYTILPTLVVFATGFYLRKRRLQKKNTKSKGERENVSLFRDIRFITVPFCTKKAGRNGEVPQRSE